MEKPETFSDLDGGRLQKTKTILQDLRIILRSSMAYSHQVEKKTGIGSSQLWLLAEIVSVPGIKVNDLAKILAIHQSTCSNILDKLQKKDLIRRDRSGEDQRVVHLYPTEKGSGLLADAPLPVMGILADALQRLPDDVLAALYDNLEKLVDAMHLTEKNDPSLPLDH